MPKGVNTGFNQRLLCILPDLMVKLSAVFLYKYMVRIIQKVYSTLNIFVLSLFYIVF